MIDRKSGNGDSYWDLTGDSLQNKSAAKEIIMKLGAGEKVRVLNNSDTPVLDFWDTGEIHIDPTGIIGSDFLLSPVSASTYLELTEGTKTVRRGLQLGPILSNSSGQFSTQVFGGVLTQTFSTSDVKLYTRSTHIFDFSELSGTPESHVFYGLPLPITTNDATPTDLFAVPIAEGEIWAVIARVIGQQGETNRAFYYKAGFFYRNTAGNVTQQGTTQNIITPEESNSAWDCDLIADTTSQSADVRVTGAAVDVDWKGWITFFKVN